MALLWLVQGVCRPRGARVVAAATTMTWHRRVVVLQEDDNMMMIPRNVIPNTIGLPLISRLVRFHYRKNVFRSIVGLPLQQRCREK
jgi:hypothetical protein